MQRRLSRALIIIGVTALVVVFSVVVFTRSQRGPDDPAPLPEMVDPLLPDLIMAPIEDIGVTVTETGVKRLRFAAMFVNIGEGDFLVRADRPLPLAPEWTVVQLVKERGGGHTERDTPGTLLFGGDGHYHFHLREAEQHLLETTDGEVIKSVVKQGYCFFDTDRMVPDLAGVPDEPVYDPKACGSQLSVRARMGLSVGWGDKYPWNMLEQNIDISLLPDGVYRIREIADPFGFFLEADETNNEVWADVRITTVDGIPRVEVVGRSPSVLGDVRESPSPGITPTP